MSKQFIFPLRVLENARVRLTPFSLSKHASILQKELLPYPELFRYIPFGPFDKESSFVDWYNGRILHDPTQCLFYVEARPQPSDNWATAGMIGLLNSSKDHLKAEVGFVVTIPKWQRTFVTGNATGLLLQYCLNLPAEGGLGLRRVQWQASYVNQKSIDAATRLGFQFEGVLRWDRCMPSHFVDAGRNLLPPREGDPRANYEGRHSAMFGIGWDAWEGVKLENDPYPWWKEGDKELSSVKERLEVTMARGA